MRIAVTGATGQIGSLAVELLSTDGTHEVVALSRRAQGTSRQSSNVSWFVTDYSDTHSLRTALNGVDTLVFVSSDGPVADVIVHHRNVVEAAIAGGVGHVVALSGIDVDQRSPFCYAVSYGYTEQLLRESGCAFSIARTSIFTEFLITFLSLARTTGQLRIPAGDGKFAPIARADVSRCLTALALGEPTGNHHDLTGPELLDGQTIAQLAEQSLFTPIAYVDLQRDVYCKELAETGEDPWWVYAYSTMFDSIREQRWARITTTSRR